MAESMRGRASVHSCIPARSNDVCSDISIAPAAAPHTTQASVTNPLNHKPTTPMPAPHNESHA